METHLCERGCGKRVSGNKKICMGCIEEAAAVLVTQKNEEPMDNATHIMIVFDTKDKDQDDLYRADGLLVASRQNDMVRFGHDIATAQTRGFINSTRAKEFIRKMANVDIEAQSKGVNLLTLIEKYAELQGNGALIDERNGDSLIVMPGSHSHVQFDPSKLEQVKKPN